MSLLTIRARVNEAVHPTTHLGYPETVTVTGAEDLSADTVREIAQSAVDNMYGEYSSGYSVGISRVSWESAKANGIASTYTLGVNRF